MSFEIRKLKHSEIDKFIDVINVFESVFEMQNFKRPPDEYLQRLLAKDGFNVFVAVTGEKVIAGLTAYLLDAYYLKGSYLYIYDLAVLPSFQRKGIGKALIRSVIEFYKSRDVAEIFVQAELPDDHAIEFYRSTGGREEPVVSFSYSLRNN